MLKEKNHYEFYALYEILKTPQLKKKININFKKNVSYSIHQVCTSNDVN